MVPAIANAVFPGFGLLVRPAWTDPAEGTLALGGTPDDDADGGR